MRTKGWALGTALAFAGVVIACGEADPPAKQPLVVCTAGEDGCPAEKPANQKKQAPAAPNNGPTDRPTETTPPADDDPDPTPTADAGAADAKPAEPTLGAICSKLKGCCKQLEDQGYSPATCLDIVNTRNENACSLQHKQYRDFGDCS